MSRRRFKSRLNRRFAQGFWITVALLAAVIIVLRLALFHTVRIEGSSMETTLNRGSIVLVTRMFGLPERGDVVQCRFPNRSGTYVKRVVGLPGETVELKGGQTYIDGVLLPEPYRSSSSGDYAVTLGADEYLVLGDNRAQSYDSREPDMGPISRADFIGRASLMLWPIGSIR